MDEDLGCLARLIFVLVGNQRNFFPLDCARGRQVAAADEQFMAAIL